MSCRFDVECRDGVGVGVWGVCVCVCGAWGVGPVDGGGGELGAGSTSSLFPVPCWLLGVGCRLVWLLLLYELLLLLLRVVVVRCTSFLLPTSCSTCSYA
jgi:hypothetical protein